MAENSCDSGIKIDVSKIDDDRKVVIDRDSSGRIKSVSTESKVSESSCYVITASYGEHSSQLRYVRAKCKEMFVDNIFLFPFWVLYKYIIGEELAYLYSVGIYRSFIKTMIAEKIFKYTKTKSMITQFYLIILGLSGLLLLPIFLGIKLVRIVNKLFSKQLTIQT